MPGLSTEVRIFLSSTFLDLRELRREVSRLLLATTQFLQGRLDPK